MPRAPRARLAAPAAALALAVALAAGCPQTLPVPSPGVVDYQATFFLDVPSARVNPAGGNLVVARRDLDFDTRLGTLALGATWNSATGAWRWSFELSYDGALFVDASGARYAVAGVADGAAIPGSVWVRLGARTLRSKGGLVHEFDAEGRLAAVRWASGSWPRLEYRRTATPAGPRVVELVQVSDPGESTVVARFGWDGAGRLASLEDRAGRRALFGWNAAGELVQARDAFDLARGLSGRRYGYAGGALTSIESSEGERAEYGYTGGRLTSARAVGLGNPEHRFAYAARAAGGFETRVTDATGAVTTLLWDSSRRTTEVVNGVGERSRWSWSGLRPASFTAPDGALTRWTVADDDAVEERDAAGRVVTLAYQPTGEDRSAPWGRPLRRASDGLGLLEERGYDSSGRLVRTTNGAGESATFGWSDKNLLATLVDPNGLETRYLSPGEHGHPRRIERAGVVEELDYDAVGNLLVGRGTGVLPPGVVARGYDEDRNLARLELAELDLAVVGEVRALSIEHRSDGQLLRIDRPFDADSELVYDALGRAVERRDKADGVWRATRFARDALGRTAEVERPNGMRTTFQYDAAGRRSSVAHLRGGAFESGASFTWRNGRLEEVRDAAHGFSVERYAYDTAGRLARVGYPEGEALELGYDGRSRLASERYLLSSGIELRRLEHRYDGAGRQRELRDGTTPILSREFAGGRLAREGFGNGLTRTYAYDGDGFLARAELRTASGTLVERSTLAREPLPGLAPAVAWRASTATFGSLPATTHEHYWIAPVGEGAAGARVGGYAHDAGGSAVEALAYDALGNLLRVGGASDPAAQVFVYDDQRTRLRRIRRASGASVHEYAWDEAGFALARDGEGLVWDGGGRPVAVGGRASFAWDAAGRPVSATVEGVSVRMLFGGRVRADAGGAPVALELGAVRIHVLGNHHYRHVDFRGNVKLVTDAQGRVVSHARYAPYGADLVHGAGDPEAGFAQGRAAGGDLVLLGTRLYDPDAGRFLAPDPVFQLVSQHVYADGNPVWFWDPDGRSGRFALATAMTVTVFGAAASAISGNAVAAAGFAGVFVGLVVPSSKTGAAGGVALLGVLRAASALPPMQAFAGGFAAGQVLQEAIASDFGGLHDIFGDKPAPIPVPRTEKFLDLRVDTSVAAPMRGGGPGGGPSGVPPGCSPAVLAAAPSNLTWRWLIALLPIQVGLGLCWLADRRSSRRMER